MPLYKFEHKIDTLAELFAPFEHKNMTFSPYKLNFSEGRCNGWLTECSIDAACLQDAANEFFPRFYEAVSHISFVSQCHTDYARCPFIIKKGGSDIFFGSYTETREPVPLHFNKEEVNALRSLENYNGNKEFFTRMMDANQSPSFRPKVAMLAAALEALAGHTQKSGRLAVNKDFLINKVLKEEDLYDALFKHKSGIRNNIVHGDPLTKSFHGESGFDEIIYENIIDYFNEAINAGISKNALGRPRQKYGNFDIWHGYAQLRKGVEDIDIHTFTETLFGKSTPFTIGTEVDPSEF